MNQLAQDLTAARQLITNPDKWIQNHLAVDATGSSHPSTHQFANYTHWEGLEGNDPRACKWCVLGAVQKVAGCGNERFEAARDALSLASKELYGECHISDVNDSQDHDAVLACFDKAIGAQT